MSLPKINLREATIDDVSLLRYWDEQPHVVASDPDDEWDWETEIPKKHDWREMLIAELDGRPVGIIQIIDPALEETHYWGEVPHHLRAIDIWIGEANDLGKGYGTRMMVLALDKCFQHEDVTAVLIDPLASNTRAHRFYERLGFRFIEKRHFNDEECFVYSLSREDYINSASLL